MHSARRRADVRLNKAYPVERFTPAGQPVLDAALETLAEEILRPIDEGAFCTVQNWDSRIDCCIKLDNGRVVGEMVSLFQLNGQVIATVGERLKLRKADAGYKLQNELWPPILISPGSSG